MNELSFIRYLEKKYGKARGLVKGIGDDAAVLKFTKDRHLLFAADMLIEGVHFLPSTDPFRIGWKAAAVNLSDIAAMGGAPKAILISAGVSPRRGQGYIKRLVAGAAKVCSLFDVAIAGGDTNSSDKTVIDVSIIGEVEKKDLVLRSGAKADELIFVTNIIGNGKIKHLDFIPRIKESRALVKNFKVSSMIDISDGLFIDLWRVAKASNVGAVIYERLLPVDEKVKDVKAAVNYGEDFELLFTMKPAEARKLVKRSLLKGFPDVTLIGRTVSAAKGLWFERNDGKQERIGPEGYDHFKTGK